MAEYRLQAVCPAAEPAGRRARRGGGDADEAAVHLAFILRRLELRKERRRCLHVYFYYLDREFGPMHVRLQTWLPFGIQVCLNGREYLGADHERDPNARRRESGRITRLLRLLRVHGLIGKVSRTRYYRVSEKGRRVMTAALNLRDSDASRLNE